MKLDISADPLLAAADDFGALLAEIYFAHLSELWLPEVDSGDATNRTTDRGQEGTPADDPDR
jgi:hypothetical protein